MAFNISVQNNLSQQNNTGYSNQDHLIVVAVTRMKNGFCCICYCMEKHRLVRPICNVSQSFWGHQYTFTLNSMLQVTANHNWSDQTQPHGNEDMLISPNFVNLGAKSPELIYCILWHLSQPNISDIFGDQAEWGFVPEGTKCPSVGVLRVQRRDVWLHHTDEGKRRLQFRDGNGTQVDLPLTAVNDPVVTHCCPIEYVLVLIGLARPYAGRGYKFHPRRCHFLALGCITAWSRPSTPFDHQIASPVQYSSQQPHQHYNIMTSSPQPQTQTDIPIGHNTTQRDNIAASPYPLRATCKSITSPARSVDKLPLQQPRDWVTNERQSEVKQQHGDVVIDIDTEWFLPYTPQPNSEMVLNQLQPPQKAANPIALKPHHQTDSANMDSIISRLLEARFLPIGIKKIINLDESEILTLCRKSSEIFLSEPMLLELEAPMKIVGVISGHFMELLRIFELGGFPPETKYLFLGDYVDRGPQSLETICLLLAYKIKYPENFFMLRGNHECGRINKDYGFYGECKSRYNIKVWETFVDCFNCLPAAAIVEEKIFCCHGGLSPDLDSMEQIRQIKRPTDVPDEGLLCDLLWSDPDKDMLGWGRNSRGISVTFGADVILMFLKKHGFDLICRSHQVVDEGYEWFADSQLVTLFSNPKYGTAGALMSVDDTLMCSFQILKPSNSKGR